jgi:hypothetical protein
MLVIALSQDVKTPAPSRTWMEKSVVFGKNAKTRPVMSPRRVRLLHETGHNVERRVFAGFRVVRKSVERIIYTVLLIVSAVIWS